VCSSQAQKKFMRPGIAKAHDMFPIPRNRHQRAGLFQESFFATM
jgi:hypothetical protein